MQLGKRAATVQMLLRERLQHDRREMRMWFRWSIGFAVWALSWELYFLGVAYVYLYAVPALRIPGTGEPSMPILAATGFGVVGILLAFGPNRIGAPCISDYAYEDNA